MIVLVLGRNGIWAELNLSGVEFRRISCGRSGKEVFLSAHPGKK